MYLFYLLFFRCIISLLFGLVSRTHHAGPSLSVWSLIARGCPRFKPSLSPSVFPSPISVCVISAAQGFRITWPALCFLSMTAPRVCQKSSQAAENFASISLGPFVSAFWEPLVVSLKALPVCGEWGPCKAQEDHRVKRKGLGGGGEEESGKSIQLALGASWVCTVTSSLYLPLGPWETSES